MARNREERKRASARRRVETHDTGGGSNYIRLPDGWSFLSIKPGKYRLDFMCYKVKTGKGEDGGNPFFEAGELAYERTFFIHRGIGPNQDWHLCAAKTLGQPCPVCEYRAKLARDPNADEDVIKELAPKERQLWIPKDLSDPEQNFVLESSYHLFGKQLDAKIRSGDEEDGYDYFADPEDGLIVRVNFEQSDRGKWVEAADIEFKARREKYDLDVVDEMPDLDSLLIATPYDKLKRIFLQTGEDEPADKDDDDDRPTKRASVSGAEKSTKVARRTADDASLEEGDEVEYDGDLCEIIRISKDGTSMILENEDGDVFKAVGVDDVTKSKPKKADKPKPPIDDEDDAPFDDDDDEPASKKKPSKSKPPVDDDDDWDDEPEEKPKKKAAPAKTSKPAAKKPAKDDDWDDDWD